MYLTLYFYLNHVIVVKKDIDDIILWLFQIDLDYYIQLLFLLYNLNNKYDKALKELEYVTKNVNSELAAESKYTLANM